MPIQPTSKASQPGYVEIFSEFEAGLKDLEGFSHIILIYHFHRVKSSRLSVTPFLDSTPRGIFATRAPTRPNAIGISVVKLVRVEANILHIDNLDVLDETPLIDIKPYIPDFDGVESARIGWLENNRDKVQHTRSDQRFGPC